MNSEANPFLMLLKRDLKLAFRERSSFIYPLLFFSIIAIFFPLASYADKALLQEMGPAVIWVAAILSAFLALDAMFKEDYDDGSLEQLLLSPSSLSGLVFAKVLAHWLITALPILLLAPLIAQVYYLPFYTTVILFFSLLIGTPIISLIGAIVSAITVSLKQSSMLLALLLMPLFIPVLIFASGAVFAANKGLDAMGPLALLLAILILLLPVTPLVISSALRVGMSE